LQVTVKQTGKMSYVADRTAVQTSIPSALSSVSDALIGKIWQEATSAASSTSDTEALWEGLLLEIERNSCKQNYSQNDHIQWTL